MNIILILVGILFFNFIVLAHEFGHFYTARRFGVKVNEFSVGMGPKIFSVKRGETLYALRILPLGGYCMMEGEAEESGSESQTSLTNKKPWQKIIITAAGAIMNLVAGLLLSLIILAQCEGFATNKISGFAENAVSQNYGLKAGDEILNIDGVKIFTTKDISFALQTSKKTNADFKVRRNGTVLEVNDVEFDSVKRSDGSTAIKPDFYLEYVPKNFFTLFRQLFLDMISTIKIIWAGLIGLVTGKFSLKMMSGPIGVFSSMGQITSEGLKISLITGINNLISFMAMLSINLGVFNLLPLPALDGGSILLYLFELITKKKLNSKYAIWIQMVGFALFILLFLLVSYYDIMKLIKNAL